MTSSETSPEPDSDETTSDERPADEQLADEDLADGGAADESPETESSETESPETESPVNESPEAESGRRPGRTVVAAVVAALVVIALAVATGFTASWYTADRQREQLDDRYRDTARQGVLNLISVSADRADRDVDRILEGATGDFRADFGARSKDFIDVVQQMKVTSKGTVNAVGLESSNEHEATALVSATSLVTNGTGADEEPRVWRLRVHLQHSDGTILIEKVDYAV